MKKKLTDDYIQKIINLREKGNSIPEISQTLKISKSTVFRYVQGVVILPEFLTEWTGKRGGSKKVKHLKEEKANKEAAELIQEISHKEKLLFISALYWAEGNKTDFILTNTDSDLIRVFINGLREIFGVTNDQIRISIRIFDDLNRDDCLDYWSKIVKIPKKDFLSVHVLSGKKKGKLKYGMCRLRVKKGGDLLKKITAINKAFVSTLEAGM